MLNKKLSILGGGKFGSALAHAFSKTHKICIWSRSGSISDQKINKNAEIFITKNAIDAILYSDYIMIAISVANIESCFESILIKMKDENFIENLHKKHFIICSKGLSCDGFLTDVLMGVFSKFNAKCKSLSMLGGPNFSFDILNDSYVFADISSIFYEDLLKIHLKYLKNLTLIFLEFLFYHRHKNHFVQNIYFIEDFIFIN